MIDDESNGASCKKCRFSIEGYGYDAYDCRRRAPTMVQVEGWQDIRQFVPKFPVMHGKDWCGEFEPKPVPKPVEVPEHHRWSGEGPEPARWVASDGSIVYRSYADYVMD